MCGIIGYNGPRPAQVVLAGLQRMEYRGYDSAGLALADPVVEARPGGRARSPRCSKRSRPNWAPPPHLPAGHRPYPLGHPWAAGGTQRPPRI